MKQKNGTIKYTFAVLVGAVIFCMCQNLTGSVLPEIMTDYSLDLERGGLMAMFLYIGGIAAILLFSRALDRYSKPVTLMLAFGTMAVMLFLTGGYPPFPAFMVFYLIMGAGLCIADVQQNAIVSDLHQKNRDTVLSLLHGMNGLGATLIPIVSAAMGTGNWKSVYRLVSLVIMLVIVMQLILYRMEKAAVDSCAPAVKRTGQRSDSADGIRGPAAGNVKKSRSEEGAGIGKDTGNTGFFRDRRVWIILISMFFYGACQGGFLNWILKYCRDVFPQADAFLSALTLSLFWLGTTICRLAAGMVPAMRRWDARKMVILGGILAGVSLFAGLLSGNIIVLLAAAFLLGLFSGETLPKLIGLMNGWYPKKTGLASGMTCIALYLGLGMVPLFMGVIGSAFGMPVMMMIPAAGAVLSGILAIMLPSE